MTKNDQTEEAVINTENLSRNETKRLKKQQHRLHPEISKEIIGYWEELRPRNVPAERKITLCEKIFQASKSVVRELIRLKTTARVFESFIEFGNEEQRWKMFEILKNDILELCQGKYSVFAVISILKYGIQAQRVHVFNIIKDNITKLITQAVSAKAVEHSFNDFSTASQRHEMMHRMYGKSFMLFKGKKDIKHLKEMTNNSEHSDNIMNDVHKMLMVILKKQMAGLTIVQHLLFEYMTVLIENSHSESTKMKTKATEMIKEVVEGINEQFFNLCNTREGVKVAMMLYLHCGAKERKTIVTSGSKFIDDICTHDDAYLLCLTILDQTDDTKILSKYFIKPFINNFGNAADVNESLNKNGIKIMQFMLNYRDKKFFDKFVLDLLAKGDNNPFSKKDADKRAQEILDETKTPILTWLSNNIETCLQYSENINIVTSILVKCVPSTEEGKIIYEKILNTIALDLNEAVIPSDTLKRKLPAPKKSVPKKKQKFFTTELNENEESAMDVDESHKIQDHIVDTPAGQILTRCIFKLEKEGHIENFSRIIMKNVDIQNLLTFAGCNRTSFFLVNLYECNKPDVQKYLKESFGPAKEVLSKSKLNGVKILYSHLFN